MIKNILRKRLMPLLVMTTIASHIQAMEPGTQSPKLTPTDSVLLEATRQFSSLGLAHRTTKGSSHHRVYHEPKKTRPGKQTKKLHPAIVRILEADSAALKEKETMGRTEFHTAVHENSVILANLMLANDPETINTKDFFFDTPLHTAAEHESHAALLELMLKKITQTKKNDLINAQNILGWTPLHYAAHNGSKKNAELLIKYGANVTIKDKKGLMPVDIAAMQVETLLHETITDHAQTALYTSIIQIVLPQSDAGPAI